MKKLVSVAASALAVLALCLALSACTPSDPNLGKYNGTNLTVNEVEVPIKEIYTEGENYIELKASDKCDFVLSGQKIEGTYTLDGESISITIADSVSSVDCAGTLKEGKLSIDFMGYPMSFEKDKK